MKKKETIPVKDYNRLVPAVEQAAKILVYLSTVTGLQSSLTDVSKSVGISKSKAYAILNTLQRFGFVTRNTATKAYSPGLTLMTIGERVKENIDYQELAGPFLKTLAKETGGTAILGLITGADQYAIVRQESTWQLSILARENKVYPLTYGAHGKAIVAFLERGEQEKTLSERQLFFHKDPSLLDRKVLSRELNACRLTGFARDHETGHPMVKILAAPVLGENGKPIGAIELIGLFEESAVSDQGEKVVETARRFSEFLKAQTTPGVTAAIGK